MREQSSPREESFLSKTGRDARRRAPALTGGNGPPPVTGRRTRPFSWPKGHLTSSNRRRPAAPRHRSLHIPAHPSARFHTSLLHHPRAFRFLPISSGTLRLTDDNPYSIATTPGSAASRYIELARPRTCVVAGGRRSCRRRCNQPVYSVKEVSQKTWT